MDEELDPQVKLKLLEAARAAEPDTPNIKRGLGCGAAALIAGAVIGMFFASFFRRLTTGEQISMAAGTAFIAAIIAGGIAAFRPSGK
jgi:hypothetical protein